MSHLALALGAFARSSWLRLQALWLDYEIHETEAYLRECARDGLVESLHLNSWKLNAGEMRAAQIALRQDARYALDDAATHSRAALAFMRRDRRRTPREEEQPS